MYQSLSLRHFRECPDLVKSLNVSKFVGEAEHLDGTDLDALEKRDWLGRS